MMDSIVKKKLIRTTTVPESLKSLLRGHLNYLSNYFEVVGIASSGADLTMVARDEGIRTIAVDMERRIAPHKDLIALYRLYVQFKREQPAIVHSITPKAGLLTMLAGKMAGVPIRMHTYTGLVFPTKKGLMQRLLIRMNRLLCWAATHVYPEGQGVRNDLIRYQITSKPLKVLANGNVNGIDIDYFHSDQVSEEARQALKQRLGIHDTDFTFIFVGRLVGDKGINELVAAFQKVAAEISYVKLLLVGHYEAALDPLQPDTLQTIASHLRIIDAGYQQDIRPYLAIAKALVFPSYREGFPNVVMQAGAMGLPAIVTDINGCNEIISEGKNGTIIPPKDRTALAAAMKRMAEDTEWHTTLKRHVREMITTRYEQKEVWRAQVEEYQRLLSE